MDNRILMACAAWAVLGSGCGSTANDDTSAGSGGETPRECEVVGVVEGEIQCGTYVIAECEPPTTDEGGSDDGGGTAGGGDTGGGGSEGGEVDPCQEQATANEAVLSCVLDMASSAMVFQFTIHEQDISIVVANTYHVGHDGGMWRDYDGGIDLCSEESVTVHGPVSLGTCDGWDCVRNQVEGAPTLATCQHHEDCGG